MGITLSENKAPILPENIALALNEKGAEEAVSSALCGDKNTLADNLALLGNYFPIKIWFTEPVEVYFQGKWVKYTDDQGRECRKKKNSKTVEVYTFKRFFRKGRLYYMKKKNGRYGYPVDFLYKIKKWELVLKGKKADRFKNYETFRKKFDTRFIKEEEIKKLWNGKSSQHGGQYKPSDFRKMGPQGKGVMERFLRQFTHINNPNKELYRETSYGTYISERYHTYHKLGRDISISHNIKCPYVHYSSEYMGCGNGSYGLVANETTWLHLEND